MEKRRVAVRAIIIEDGKLLCVRLKKYPGKATSDGQDYWCTPGGGVDIGEPLVSALERELIEETGIKPILGRLIYIQQFQHENSEHLEFFFHVINAKDYRSIVLEETTNGVIEIAEINFIDPINNVVLPTFLSERNIALDIKDGNLEIFNYINPSSV